jgi:hypothetical protein
VTDATKFAMLLAALNVIQMELEQEGTTGSPGIRSEYIRRVIRDALIRVGESDG